MSEQGLMRKVDSWGGEPWTVERAKSERAGLECSNCTRAMGKAHLMDAVIQCPTCKGRSGDPYSVFDPFYCDTCGGAGTVPLVHPDEVGL